MKIGILTHYNVSSHGALLQLYAMQEELKKMGHEVFVLTYNKNMDFIDENTKKRFSASLRNLPWYIKNYIFINGLSVTLYQFRKQKVLSAFRNMYFKMIPYVNSNELDAVIVGADEVFSLENGVNFMMFGHGITSKKIIAYAPSCGQTDIVRVERYGMKELISSGLKKFDALSARDLRTKELIEDLLDVEVPLVCDPVLLYSFGNIKKRKNKRYIVVYSYQSNFKEQDRIEKIKQYANRHKCELWSVGVYYKWCDKKINVSPLEMLEIFAGAETVITDTFHGTISSYIVHTPVVVFVRDNNNVKLDHLLRWIGLEDRKVKTLDELEDILSTPQDFDNSDFLVKSIRQRSIDYLKTSLEK